MTANGASAPRNVDPGELQERVADRPRTRRRRVRLARGGRRGVREAAAVGASPPRGVARLEFRVQGRAAGPVPGRTRLR